MHNVVVMNRDLMVYDGAIRPDFIIPHIIVVINVISKSDS